MILIIHEFIVWPIKYLKTQKKHYAIFRAHGNISKCILFEQQFQTYSKYYIYNILYHYKCM